MFHRHIELYLHFIWRTWDRHRWIDTALQPHLHAVVASVARKQGCSFVEVGGVSEHVHVLVRAPPTVAPSDLVRHLKGISSHVAHAELGVDSSFTWSEGYALFSVDHSDVDSLAEYIRDQPRRHATNTHDPRRELPA